MLFYKKPNFDEMSEESIKKAKAINNINREIVSKIKYKDGTSEIDVDSFIISKIDYFSKKNQISSLRLYETFDVNLLNIYDTVIKDARNFKKTTKKSVYNLNLEESNVFIIYLYLLGYNFKYKINEYHSVFDQKYCLDLKINLLDDGINRIYHQALNISKFKVIDISYRNLDYHRHCYIFEKEYRKKFENKKKLLLIQYDFIFQIFDHNTYTIYVILSQLYPELKFEIVQYDAHKIRVTERVVKNDGSS